MEEERIIKKADKRKKEKKNARKIHGPVPDLERNVDSQWWSKIFNKLYLKTDGDVVEDQNITRKEVDLFIGILGLGKEEKTLDLCCGQGRHTLELSSRGYKNVEGLDRSHYLIQRVKTLSKKRNLDVKFKEGDARKLPYSPDTFDNVLILGNSFGYFETIQDDLRVLKEVFRVLKPWGKILIDVSDDRYMRENFQPRSWEWITENYFVYRERSLSYDKQRLISRELITDARKGIIADQFYAERLYSQERMSELLKEAGFSHVRFHGELSPDSQRNQDLGMMEKRIIVTAVVRKEWTSVKKKPKEEVKEIIVVMGNPDKPDILKPSSVFDEDDFYTIDQLKGALKDIKGFRFSFLTKHDTLIQDLMKLKDKMDFVFNLCDEGFDNDPSKELHVPSVLEMLELGYTGSGPQCLAFCYDKSLVRGIAKEMGIPVPEAFFIQPEDTAFELTFELPVLVKPNFGDSSFGITQNSVAYNYDELLNAISEIRNKYGYEKPILVEEFLTGKDISVGIIGNPPGSYRVLPITRKDYSNLPEHLPRICGYEAK